MKQTKKDKELSPTLASPCSEETVDSNHPARRKKYTT
jgi:hypothetical protein